MARSRSNRAFATAFLVSLGAHGAGAAEETRPCAEIVAVPRSGIGPLRVRFEAIVARLAGPLRYRWDFGDGQESSDPAPEPHRYSFGKYSVVLEIVDKDGKICSASVSIEAAAPG